MVYSDTVPDIEKSSECGDRNLIMRFGTVNEWSARSEDWDLRTD